MNTNDRPPKVHKEAPKPTTEEIRAIQKRDSKFIANNLITHQQNLLINNWLNTGYCYKQFWHPNYKPIETPVITSNSTVPKTNSKRVNLYPPTPTEKATNQQTQTDQPSTLTPSKPKKDDTKNSNNSKTVGNQQSEEKVSKRRGQKQNQRAKIKAAAETDKIKIRYYDKQAHRLHRRHRSLLEKANNIFQHGIKAQANDHNDLAFHLFQEALDVKKKAQQKLKDANKIHEKSKAANKLLKFIK